ncbi:MAG: protein-export chaperone SecB [Holosporales bacterium]|jgi:preprotein translocase subunit SecB|nr:protein-export chaperone SecB [Holosporales bacterium]
MTDNSTNTQPQEQASLFVIHIQYLKDLSFENPNPLAYFTSDQPAKPDININVQVNARRLTENMFEVVLEVNVDAKREKEQMFICQVQYAALISLQKENLEEKEIRKILLENCPQIIFPFARNIVAEVTVNSGFQPLLLHPIDFATLSAQQNEGNEGNNGQIH